MCFSSCFTVALGSKTLCFPCGRFCEFGLGVGMKRVINQIIVIPADCTQPVTVSLRETTDDGNDASRLESLGLDGLFSTRTLL